MQSESDTRKKKKEIQINLISTTFHLRLSLKGR